MYQILYVPQEFSIWYMFAVKLLNKKKETRALNFQKSVFNYPTEFRRKQKYLLLSFSELYSSTSCI